MWGQMWTQFLCLLLGEGCAQGSGSCGEERHWRWTGEEASAGLVWGSSVALAGLMTISGTLWGWERVTPAPHPTARLCPISHLPLPGSFHSLAPPKPCSLKSML